MRAIFATVALFTSISVHADPKCDSANNWAAAMTHAHLKNAGIIVNSEIDFNLTEVKRLASERIDTDLYRQVHYVVYVKKSGERIEAIATNDASSQECSMGPVKVFVIKGTYGG